MSDTSTLCRASRSFLDLGIPDTRAAPYRCMHRPTEGPSLLLRVDYRDNNKLLSMFALTIFGSRQPPLASVVSRVEPTCFQGSSLERCLAVPRIICSS